MGHCLLIFIFSLSHVLLWGNSQSIPETSANHISLNSAESSKATGSVQAFNKSVFLIPLSGILLVITMVLLYICYTCKISQNQETGGPGPKLSANDMRLSEFNISSDQEPSNQNITSADSPPSYQEATLSTYDPVSSLGRRK